jgi:hypothetical protein
MPPQELITNLLDLAIDVPQVWDNLASLVSLLIRLGMTPYEWLQALARQSLPEEPDFIRSVHHLQLARTVVRDRIVGLICA